MQKRFKILFIITNIFLICSFNSFGQTDSLDNNIRICGEFVETIIIVNRVAFKPKSQEYNIDFRKKKKEDCWNCTHINYIDGLEVSDEILNNLGLSLKRNRDVIDSLTCYSFKYRNDDPKNCIETYYYYVTLKIPIILNGVKLNHEEKETILSAIKMDEIHEVKTKRNFWGKALAVEITTVEKIQNKVSCNSRRKIKKNGANIWTNADTQ